MVFCPSDSSTDHRCLNNSPLHSAPATQAGSWLFLNTLNMLLPQGFCNCSICNTLLPNTHIACSLTCLRSLLTNQFLRELSWAIYRKHLNLHSTKATCSYYTALVGGLVIKPCPILVTPWSPPGSSVHGIFQARILEWAVISFSRGSSRPRDQTCISCDGRGILSHCVTWEAQRTAHPIRPVRPVFVLRNNWDGCIGPSSARSVWIHLP